jgi:hypothetical protein
VPKKLIQQQGRDTDTMTAAAATPQWRPLLTIAHC